MREGEGSDLKHEKAQRIPEAADVSPYHAYSIFENAMIKFVNNRLETSGKQVISSDEPVKLEWLFDEKTSEGRFVIIKSKASATENESEDDFLGPEEPTREIPTNLQFQGETRSGTVYDDFTSEEVRQVFNKLEPAVKISFIDGLQESLDENEALVRKYNMKLKDEKRKEEKTKLENEIKKQEEAQKKLKDQKEALA